MIFFKEENILDFSLSWGLFQTKEDHYFLGKTPSYHTQPAIDRPSFYINDFFLQNKTPWVLFEEVVEVSRETLLSFLEEEERGEAPDFKEKEGVFEEIFKSVKEAILLKKIKKGLAYTSFEVDFEGEKGPFFKSLLKGALLDQKKGYLIGFWDKGKGFLGKTPELLFKEQEGVLQTEALAGTFVVGNEGEVRGSLKEEHLVVERELEAILAPLGQLEKTRGIKRFGDLEHLHTCFELVLKDCFEFEEWITLLHPTSAIGTFPKNSFFLKELAKIEERGYFGAPAGYFLPETGEKRAFVLIRTLFFEENKIVLPIGCGIIEESVFSEEEKEVAWKKRATLSTFFRTEALV